MVAMVGVEPREPPSIPRSHYMRKNCTCAATPADGPGTKTRTVVGAAAAAAVVAAVAAAAMTAVVAVVVDMEKAAGAGGAVARAEMVGVEPREPPSIPRSHYMRKNCTCAATPADGPGTKTRTVVGAAAAAAVVAAVVAAAMTAVVAVVVDMVKAAGAGGAVARAEMVGVVQLELPSIQCNCCMMRKCTSFPMVADGWDTTPGNLLVAMALAQQVWVEAGRAAAWMGSRWAHKGQSTWKR